jgi:hypothetical protein
MRRKKKRPLNPPYAPVSVMDEKKIQRKEVLRGHSLQKIAIASKWWHVLDISKWYFVLNFFILIKFL